ncbi:MAG: 2,3-cyclic 3-phosphodiesterase [Micromonosporaceae bacterium]
MAVYPPAAALDHLGATVDQLEIARAAGRGINTRLAARPLWHVTLAFLGDVPDPAADAAAAALDRAAGRVERGPVLHVAGGGRFGRGKFTILWTGLGGQVAELKALAQTLRRELRRGRLPYDDKPLRPHLTLARPGDRLPAEAIGADLAALADYRGPEWTVESARLVRSYPGPHPRYETLHTVALT